MNKTKMYTIVNSSLLFIEYYWKAILILILSIALIFSVRSCHNNKQQVANLEAKYKWELGKNDSLVNATGKKVIQSNVITTGDEKFVKKESDKAFNLKKKDAKKIDKVNITSEIDHSFSIENDIVKYDYDNMKYLYTENTSSYDSINSVIYPIGSYKYDCDSCFSAGETFKKIDSTYEISITLVVEDGQKGVKVNKLLANDSIYWRLAETKRGLFKPPSTIVQVTNTNPKFKLNGTRTIQIKNKVGAWNKWIKPTLVGIGVGIITYKVTK